MRKKKELSAKSVVWIIEIVILTMTGTVDKSIVGTDYKLLQWRVKLTIILVIIIITIVAAVVTMAIILQY